MDVNKLKQTPLSTLQIQQNPEMDWFNWSGYRAPQLFTSIRQEALAIRRQATVFDLYPLRKYRIKGGGALDFLNKLCTRNISLSQDQAIYTSWCNRNGRVIDDGIVFCLDSHDFLLATELEQLAYLRDVASAFDVCVTDACEVWTGLALQGPESSYLLAQLGFEGLNKLPRFGIYQCKFGNIPMFISRTGFTGALGFELWIDPAYCEPLWVRLCSLGALPIGMQALLISRLEAGFFIIDRYPCFEVVHASFDGSADSEFAKSPYELGIGYSVDFKKHGYIGRDALSQERLVGAKFILSGIVAQGEKLLQHNTSVYLPDGTHVGFVTSCAYSYFLKKTIAIAFLESRYDNLFTRGYVDHPNGKVSVVRSSLPFIGKRR